MTAGVFRVVLEVDVHPGAGPDFERTWREVADAIGVQPANLGQWLLRRTDAADRYVVVTDWTDERAFREFETSGPHVRNRRLLAPFRRGGSMATTRIVADHTPQRHSSNA